MQNAKYPGTAMCPYLREHYSCDTNLLVAHPGVEFSLKYTTGKGQKAISKSVTMQVYIMTYELISMLIVSRNRPPGKYGQVILNSSLYFIEQTM